MKVSISSKVKTPSEKGKRGRPLQMKKTKARSISPSTRESYPFSKMEVGQSFFVPNTSTGEFSAYRLASQRLEGRKFTARTVSNGVRVWRVQ